MGINLNNIFLRQNEEGNVDLLVAQRQLYSDAKSISNYQFAICVVMPICILFLKAAVPSSSIYLGVITLLSLIILIVNQYYFEKIIKDKKEKAARFQELFDSNVLTIKWNNELCGSKEIAARNLGYTVQKHKENNESIENLKDWYPKEYETVHLSVARIMCQKVNASWDGQLRNAFQNFLVSLLAVCVVLIIVISIVLNKTFIETLISTIAPLFPIAFYIFKRYSENKDTIAGLEKLTYKAESLWNQLLNSTMSQNDLENKSRQLQNEIYKHRSSALLIWDWFYFKFRSKQESSMNETAKLIVEEYLNRGATN